MDKDPATYGWSEKPRIAIRALISNSSLSAITAIQARWAPGPWLSGVALFQEKRRDHVSCRTPTYPEKLQRKRNKYAAQLWLLVHSLCPMRTLLLELSSTLRCMELMTAQGDGSPKDRCFNQTRAETKGIKPEETGYTGWCNFVFQRYKDVRR